jgi:hypothetical protein
MHLHELGEPWREIADLLRTQLVDRVENAFIAWEEKKGPHINDEEMLASLVALSEIEVRRGRDFRTHAVYPVAHSLSHLT